MKENQAIYPVRIMCRVLKVSASGYYAWRRRGPCRRRLENRHLLWQIHDSHRRSRGTYGALRIRADLAERDVRVSAKRIARLMRHAGLRGACRRRWQCTTKRNRHARLAPDRVQRRFQANRPNVLWFADITYLKNREKDLFLAVVIDAYSRRVVGWSLQEHLRHELVLDALHQAVKRRGARGIVHHSDRGCQYTSNAFLDYCRMNGLQVSMGSVGDCYDNAMCESFFATLKCEALHRKSWDSAGEMKREVFEYIEGWYNRHRRHSSLGYRSPVHYEQQFNHAA